MKKLLIATVVLALSLPMVAGASSYTSSFAPGKYKGTVKAIVPELNGTTADLSVEAKDNAAILTVSGKDWKEVWTVTDNKLDQKEYDPKTNKETQSYGATAKAAPAGTSQTFYVNCKSKTECDNNIDYRNNWTVAGGNEIKYTLYGVAKELQKDANAKSQQRFELTFKKVK